MIFSDLSRPDNINESSETEQLYHTSKTSDQISKIDEDLLVDDIADETENSLTDIKTLLYNTDPKKIYLTSDWHFFKNHYKHEANYVNTQKILTWCRQNIKDDDVFFYMGDICYKYANSTDKKESQKLMASIPGIKILLLGNHDIMLGEDYYSACGFKYVIESLEWNNYVFTHKPIDMTLYDEDTWNIHGHIHNIRTYNTSDGSRNINVYPYFNDNKPYTLDYITKHKKSMTKENHRSNWTNIGESYNFKTNSIKSLELIYESARKSDIASTVFYSPEITSNNIAYMLSPFKDRLKGHIGITVDCGYSYNTNILNARLMNATIKTTKGSFVYSANITDPQQLKNTLVSAGYANNAELDQLDIDEDLTLYIPNGNKMNKTDYGDIIHKGNHLSSINIGGHIKRYDSLVVVTHVYNDKFGYYGAIENIAKTIPSESGESKIFNGETGFIRMERAAEATSAILDYFEDNIVYVNILQDMNAGKIPNIGILVSDDIVAVEQATIDFIRNCKNNKSFMENIGRCGSYHQIEYAEWLNLGTKKYKLYDINNNRLKLEASYFNESNKANLPDSAFGIPEDRKFPLDTEQHVKSAIKLFGHAEESKKKSLASRIKNAASKYDITIPETTQCYKYLHESIDLMIPSEVTNIVFDLGSVLVNDRTADLILDDPTYPREYFNDLYDIITTKMFDTKVHKYLHTCDLDQASSYLINNSPKYLRNYIKPLIYSFSKTIYKYDYVDEMLDMLKKNDYHIYYLSNWSYYTYEICKDFFDALLSKFDGGLFSYEIDVEKPDPEIYNAFLDKYNLSPESCVFFDDKAENVDAAKSVGMNAIVFDKETTPYEIIGTYDCLNSELNEMFLAESEYGIHNIKMDDVKGWYICPSKDPKDVDEDFYQNNIEKAIEYWHPSYNSDEYYVYTHDEDYKMILLGKIRVNDDYTYNWIIQYPLMSTNGKMVSCIEWAMSSCNPIIGITKPFILKIGGTREISDTLDPKQYAFSPDIISDKFLVVNENAELEIVDSSEFNDKYVEEYEYIGNQYNIRKIAEAYNNHDTVDNTFFYTALTNKPMLTEDQIDFDKSFKKVDFEFLKEKQLSEMATLRDSIIRAMGYKTAQIPIEEDFIMKNVTFLDKYNTNGEFSIREDFDGYYFYNESNNKRSASVATSNMLSEAMLRSIL